MLLGEFRRKLKRVNPDLAIYCGNSPRQMAGIHDLNPTAVNDMAICGVSKGWMPLKQSIQDGKTLHIIKRSVKDVLIILARKHKIDRRKAQRVFGFNLAFRVPMRVYGKA